MSQIWVIYVVEYLCIIVEKKFDSSIDSNQ